MAHPSHPTPAHRPLHLAVALGDTSSRSPSASSPPTSPAFWAHLVREAEAALLDLVVIDAGHLDDGDLRGASPDLAAVLVATRAAAATRRIGLVPTVHVGGSEPGRLARAVSALHRESRGRAGVQLHVPVRADEEGWVAAVRRRWDGSEQPLVVLPSHGRPDRGAVSPAADVGVVTPVDAAGAARAAAVATRASDDRQRLLADVVVVLDDDADRARERADALPRLDPDDALRFAGTPAQLADLAQEWHAAGLAGLRLRPAELTRDLLAVTRGLVPELQRRGAFRRSYDEPTLHRPYGTARAAEHVTAA